MSSSGNYTSGAFVLGSGLPATKSSAGTATTTAALFTTIPPRAQQPSSFLVNRAPTPFNFGTAPAAAAVIQEPIPMVVDYEASKQQYQTWAMV